MADSTALRARPTTYKGVAMRSRLEAAWAEQFDAWGDPWEYEPRCYASDAGQYLPDFVIDGEVFVEVKPWIDCDHLHHVLLVEMPRAARILRDNLTGPWAFILVFGATSNRVIHTFVAKETSRGDIFFLPNDTLAPSAPVESLQADRFAY